jgi:hypothetical protein
VPTRTAWKTCKSGRVLTIAHRPLVFSASANLQMVEGGQKRPWHTAEITRLPVWLACAKPILTPCQRRPVLWWTSATVDSPRFRIKHSHDSTRDAHEHYPPPSLSCPIALPSQPRLEAHHSNRSGSTARPRGSNPRSPARVPLSCGGASTPGSHKPLSADTLRARARDGCAVLRAARLQVRPTNGLAVMVAAIVSV